MSRRAWWILSAACGLFLALWLAMPSRPPPTPEEQVRALLEEAARAAGDRKADRVVALLSDRFDGVAEGEHVAREEVKRLLALELMRGEWVSVTLSSAQVVVDGKRARAHVDAVLGRAADRGRGLAALLPGEASAHRFRLDLEEEGGRWRVVAARWRRISLEEALSGPGPPDW
ncbi:MAG TPA: hypothetical protein VFG53_00325 [Anaeromyxobacter sp.]|nr:hypothetical protein [Anaeromyxobacter sp.]